MTPFSDWLDLHQFDQDELQNVVASWRSGALPGHPSWLTKPAPTTTCGPRVRFTRQECLEKLVKPAFQAGFGDRDLFDALSGRFEFAENSAGDDAPPHTVDRGPDAPVLIALDWTGSPEDVICLAHEAAHAMQILLSGHDRMPPVAREVCAFLGELMVIGHARGAVPDLYPALRDVWHRENGAYLGTDLDPLIAGLADPRIAYHYRQNYPLARLMAVELFDRGAGNWLKDLFASGRQAMRHLPTATIARKAGPLASTLPPVPAAAAEQPSIDAYRSLGIMTLIDLSDVEGVPEQRISDYYATLSRHLQDRTAFIALDEDRRPVGHAIWTPPDSNGAATIIRQSTPFCDPGALQRALRLHLGDEPPAFAPDDRSAGQEQRA